MKHALPLAAALVLASAATAQAQPAPTGPFLVLETSPDVLSVLATGSRTRSGDQATLTWILLKNPPGADGTARTDIGTTVDCARKAWRHDSFVARKLDGNVIQIGKNPKAEWMPLKAGRTDQTLLALACEGKVTSETGADLDRIAADWRATKWD